MRLGTVASAARLAETNLLPKMNRLPGFVAYYLLDAGDGIIASVSVCDSREGAAAAATLAAEWFRSDWPSFQLIPPEVTDGEVLVHGEMSRATAGGGGRRQGERRAEGERRLGQERRVAEVAVDVERRTGERRAQSDRRAAAERRGTPKPPRLGVAPAWRKPSRVP